MGLAICNFVACILDASYAIVRLNVMELLAGYVLIL